MNENYRYPNTDFTEADIEETLQDMREDVEGYNNGHRCFMITGIKSKEELKEVEKFIATWKVLDRSGVGGGFHNVKSEMAPNFDFYFLTCDTFGGIASTYKDDNFKTKKMIYLPNELAEAFPDLTIYTWDAWQNIGLDIYKNGAQVPTDERDMLADFTIDDVFSDEGNLRLDIAFTDKATRSRSVYGDLICLDSIVDVINVPYDDTYKELTMFLSSEEDMKKVATAVADCMEYHREREEDEER